MKCISCEYHSVQADPDPNDWFCQDDEKIVCVNPMVDSRVIDCSLRPYQTKNVESPDWCPLIKFKRNETIEKIIRSFV